jgi:ABC-type multidrug transport system ATPase subunit
LKITKPTINPFDFNNCCIINNGCCFNVRGYWALQQFELEAEKNTNSGDLPLGYKQRLAMACALMHEPEILFLDKPTSGVDPLRTYLLFDFSRCT